MLTKKIALGAAALAAAGGIVAGGAAISNASTQGAGAGSGYGAAGYGTPGQEGPDGAGRGGHQHTEVTGTAATKVKDAVTAKDSSITVEKVLQDPDGSYDVLGTKAGDRVMVEVSKDLATVEVRTGGPGGPGGRGGKGGPGAHQHTEVTGAEATKVKDAVTAKDSSITVESVRKDPDGSYDVLGTKAGDRVMVEVSKDLATVEVRTGGPGGPGGHGGNGGRDGQRGPGGPGGSGESAPTQSSSASPSASA